MNTPNLTRAIVCSNCGLVNDYRTKQNGPHTEAVCNGCDRHIKFIATKEPTFYFGKYKDRPVDSVDDVSYLEWALRNCKLSAQMRDAIIHQIDYIQNLAR